MKTYLPLLVGFLIVAMTGAMHHARNAADESTQDIEALGDCFQLIPTEIDDWKGTDLTLERELLEAGRIEAYLYRRYENQKNGHELQILLVCGRPGPISVHTPDVCYRGAGYTMPTPVAYQLHPGETTAGLMTVCMRRPDSRPLRIFWTWSIGQGWRAPDNPRIAFARHPFLCKLYVLREHLGTTSTDDTDADPCIPFMESLLPAIDAVLNQQQAPSAR